MSTASPIDLNSQPEALVEGVWLVDKPETWSSHDVVNVIRRRSKIKRVGHAGTLDPLATGLLIVLVGRDFTKLQDGFMKADKTYLCTIRLGVTSDTYDQNGEITSQAEWSKLQDLTEKKVQDALKQFQGTITQTVPAYSAIKRQGQTLYHQARQGILDLTTLPSRQVTLYDIKLLSFDKDAVEKTLHIELEVSCSSGTYIRSLAHDLGQVLGVGGMITALRRTKSGEFNIDQAWALDLLLQLKPKKV